MSGMQRALRPLIQRMQLMVGRAVLLLVNDGLKLQGLQISLLADEVRDNVERFQDYGFTCHPHPGAEAVAVSVAGSRDHVIVIAVDDRRYRLRNLVEGEVAIYTDEGDKVVLKRGGVIEVTAGTKVRLVAETVECTGDLTVAGDVKAGGDVLDLGGTKSMAGMRGDYNAHTHGGSGTDRPM